MIFYTPDAEAARSASSTPSTIAAPEAPSAALPYAYSMFTPASARSCSTGANAPGLFEIARHDDLPLADLVMLLAQGASRPYMVVHDEPKLSAGFDRHRDDVDAFV